MTASLRLAIAITATGLLLNSCRQLNDERIPHMPVNIVLDDQGMWSTFGVQGYGMWRNFILGNGMRVPSNFPFTSTTYTGYGGVLLISGLNPFSGEVGPLAYDLSCPVERLSTVRVLIDEETFQAVCPVCNSHYDVTQAGGIPLSGPAKEMNYGLTPYQSLPTINGGYIIRD